MDSRGGTSSAPAGDSPGAAVATASARRRALVGRPPLGVGIACALLLLATVIPALLMLSIGLPGASGAPATSTSASATSTPTTKPSATPTGPFTAGQSALTVPMPLLGGLQQVQNVAQLAYVNSLIAKMSLDEEIGQMVMISFNETQMDSTLQYEIQQYHVGSVVLYAFNITSDKNQVKSLVSGLQAASPSIPLLVATDQEGGGVNRLENVEGPVPSAAAMSTWAPQQIAQRGQQDATAMASLGINVNFAPVVDVPPVPGGIGDLVGRTFGDTPQQVTTNAGAYLAGVQQSGQVIGTLKHFPGLGDVPTDPHAKLYHLQSSLNTLESVDWAPYKALLATGQVHMIMSTHVVDDAVDPTLPASLSVPVLTGILRNQLGYDGVIVTDGLYMGALYGLFPGDQNAAFQQIFLHAVAAGNDLMCSLWSIQTTQLFEQTIHDAVNNGTISKARIDASVRRILLLKLQLGLIKVP